MKPWLEPDEEERKAYYIPIQGELSSDNIGER
jgi:hypothetical protein